MRAARVARYARFARYGIYGGAAIGAGYMAYRGVKRLRRITNAKHSTKKNRFFVAGSQSANATVQRKTLFANRIEFIEPPGGNDKIRGSPSMSFFVKSIKLCATFANTSQVPIHMHMALIQPKQADVTAVSDITTDMFVDSTSSSDKFVDFIPLSLDTSWDRGQDCRGLNKNKFNIVTHQKFLLNPGQDPTTEIPTKREHGSSWRHFEKYYKINKRFEFDTNTDAYPTHPLWLLVWWETVLPNNSSFTNTPGFNVNINSYIKDT